MVTPVFMIFRNHNNMRLIAQEIFLNMTTALCFLFVIFFCENQVCSMLGMGESILNYQYIDTDASFENIDT